MNNLIVIACLALMSFGVEPVQGLQRNAPEAGIPAPRARNAPEAGIPAPRANRTVRNFGRQLPDQPGLAIPSLDPIAGPRRGNDLQQAIHELKTADSDEDKSAAKKTIKTELEKQYDAFLENDQKKVDQLFDRLKKLEEQLERRREAKNRLVDLKLEMLISQAEGLGWPTDNGWNRGPGSRSFGPAFPGAPSPNFNPNSNLEPVPNRPNTPFRNLPGPAPIQNDFNNLEPAVAPLGPRRSSM